jgi:hypothetical protein
VYILQLFSGEFGGEALQTDIVMKDPAIYILGIPERMASKPLHPELRVRQAC